MNTHNSTISIFLVDDNNIFLKGLAGNLKEYFRSEVVIESFTTGEDCLKKIEKNPKTGVDVVILDFHLDTESTGAMNGIEILKKIKAINPKIIVIMLSAEDKLQVASESLSAGAYEYVVKSETAFLRIQNILKNSLEREFDSKILKITTMILEKHPELYQYIGEMNETIPDEKNPHLTLKNLKNYYNSLESMLDRYVKEHAKSE